MSSHIRLIFAAVLGSIPMTAQAEIESLIQAYPHHLVGISDGYLIWTDGTKMAVIDERSKTDEEALNNPTIKDMFRDRYISGRQNGSPINDAGRYRNLAFFQKMYGDCSSKEFRKNLTEIEWMPKFSGGKIWVTKVNNVDKKLAAIVRELSELQDKYIDFLIPSAGGFNCRKIEGTQNVSAHSFGIAIDINVKYSHYWRWQKESFKNLIPYEIVEVFEKHGFIWGGKWRHFDTMHFEYRPELKNR